jgi:tRNA (5-methylaminomethyl-2-thiouridylate)-methyltransferase
MTLIRVPLAAKRRIAVAVSGGVDSAVAAALLKHDPEYKEADIVGVFMRNWDEAEEWSAVSNANCTVEQDYRDASRVCGALGLPLVELDFVRTYYTRVFEPFLESLRRGYTPNPDVACNRVVKFDALLGACRQDLGADVLATGHYARTVRVDGGDDYGHGWRLLQGRDTEYDQTYFLSSVDRAALSRVLFPLGELTKQEVRELARDFGLSKVSEKKSSTGICFIGKRNFGAFVEEYLPPRSGVFIDVDDLVLGSGDEHGNASAARPTPLGPCRNIHALTYGQNAGIGGLDRKAFVVGKDLRSDVVYVCRDREHPSLYTSSALVEDLHWISESHERVWETTRRLSGVQYKARYREPQRGVSEMLMEDGNGMSGPPRPRPSRYWGLDGENLKGEDLELSKPSVWISFTEPAYAITPGQYIVLYDGEVCVASARIVCPSA